MTIRLLDLLSPSQPILYTAIFDYLDPPDIVRLLATCRALRMFQLELWNINRSLRRFVDDPLKFRSLMARHNALVSGSYALQFFARVKWVDSDLDVYISGEKGLLDYSKYLLENEGYSFLPYTWQSKDVSTAISEMRKERDAYIMSKISPMNPTEEEDTSSELALYTTKEINGVLNFVHPTKAHRKIQLISARVLPLNALLGDYYATHIFNFFTWNRAYSLFPYHTFGKNHAFYTKHPTGSSQRGVEKYIGRGFKFKDYGDLHKCVKNCPFRPHRRVGDKYCWVLDLDTYGVDDSSIAVPQDVMETSTWGMKMHYSWWSREDNKRVFTPLQHINIRFFLWFNEIEYAGSPVFKYSRIVDGHNLSWRNFIDMMNKTTKKQSSYLIHFSEAKTKDWQEPGQFWMDGEFASWYQFWETSLMPYENIWQWQYPMLERDPEITVNGVISEEKINHVELTPA